MSETLTVQIDLRFEPGAYDGFYGAGSTIRIVAAFLDGGAAPLAVTGAAVEVETPGALLPTVYTEGAGLVADGVGRWVVDVELATLGDWRVTASCTGPAPQSRLRRFVVAASPDARLPPVLVTADLAPVITQRGGMLTGLRLGALPELGTLTDDAVLYVVQNGADFQISLPVLIEAAAEAAVLRIPTQFDFSNPRNSGLLLFIL